jgi:hypothetical protein
MNKRGTVSPLARRNAQQARAITQRYRNRGFASRLQSWIPELAACIMMPLRGCHT